MPGPPAILTQYTTLTGGGTTLVELFVVLICQWPGATQYAESVNGESKYESSYISRLRDMNKLLHSR